MKLTGDFKYQGSGQRTGIKDPTKIYFEVALLSGIEQLRCTCEQDFFNKVLPTVKPFTDCKCTFTLNPTYNTLRLVDIQPVK